MASRDGFIPKFQKVVGMFDSDRAPERTNAFDLALKLCNENGTTFREACAKAFGGGSDEETLEMVEELQRDNQTLSEAVTALKEELEIARESGGSDGNAEMLLIAKVWSFPQTRLAATLALLALRFWLLAEVVPGLVPASYQSYTYWMITLAVAFGVFAGLEEWSGAEFRKCGAGAVVLKTLIIVPGIYACLASFSGTNDPRGWASSAANESGAYVLLAITAALTISNICRWLAGQLAHSRQRPFQLLREWFA